MDWLLIFTSLWGVILALVGAFIALDVRNWLDNDPNTPTFSDFIEDWMDRGASRPAAVVLALIAMLAIPVFLFLDLVVRVV